MLKSSQMQTEQFHMVQSAEAARLASLRRWDLSAVCVAYQTAARYSRSIHSSSTSHVFFSRKIQFIRRCMNSWIGEISLCSLGGLKARRKKIRFHFSLFSLLFFFCFFRFNIFSSLSQRLTCFDLIISFLLWHLHSVCMWEAILSTWQAQMTRVWSVQRLENMPF